MFTLFDLLSLFYVAIGIRALWTLYKNRRAFTDAELTSFDRRLAGELAFFVFVPIGVLFHELGHAAATYQAGGSIDWLGGGFHYALFWGYVIPEGDFSILQGWWIALAGNLVSVLYGFLPLLFLPAVKRAWMKYTILSFSRIQLGWSLVGYPLLTLTGIDGDWSTIYSSRTLALSLPLFVLHVALVAGLWWLDRSAWLKRWELRLYADTEPLRSLDTVIATYFDKSSKSVRVTGSAQPPDALDALIARGSFFASHNQFDLALNDYRTALQVDPQNLRALYNIGQIHLQKRRLHEAEKVFRAALKARQGNPQITARLHYGLALSLYQRGKANDALGEFDQAILGVPDIPEFYFWRGLARRQMRDNACARADFERASALSAESNPALAQEAREMLKSTGE